MFELIDKIGNIECIAVDDCVNLDTLDLRDEIYFIKGLLKDKPKYIEFVSVFADYCIDETSFYNFLTGVKTLDEYDCYDTTPEYMIYVFACIEPYEHSLTFKHKDK